MTFCKEFLGVSKPTLKKALIFDCHWLYINFEQPLIKNNKLGLITYVFLNAGTLLWNTSFKRKIIPKVIE